MNTGNNDAGTMEKTSQGMTTAEMQIGVSVTSQSAGQKASIRKAMKRKQ